MNAKQRRQYEMFLRLRRFGNDHQELFSESPVALQAFESLNAAINELTATDLMKMSASASARADRQKRTRATLIEVLTKVSQLARVLQARGQTMPVFQLPASRSDQQLLSTARQFAHDGAPFEAEFAAHGVGTKLIADTAAAFETAVSNRGTKRTDAMAARGRIRELLAAAFLDVRQLDLIVNSALAGHTAIRDVWTQIRHVLEARGARSGAAADTTAEPPAPSRAATPAPGQAGEPAPQGNGVEQPATMADAPTPADVIDMPSREVA